MSPDDDLRPGSPTLAELDALIDALEETGWILALYPAVNGIGPPVLVREGVWEGSSPARRPA